MHRTEHQAEDLRVHSPFMYNGFNDKFINQLILFGVRFGELGRRDKKNPNLLHAWKLYLFSIVWFGRNVRCSTIAHTNNSPSFISGFFSHSIYWIIPLTSVDLARIYIVFFFFSFVARFVRHLFILRAVTESKKYDSLVASPSVEENYPNVRHIHRAAKKNGI